MQKKIPLEKAEPGMILAQQLTRDDGVLLSNKGTEITEGLLKMLDRLNFETVTIEEGEVETPEEQAARQAKEEIELEIRFSNVSSDPILQELKSAMLERLKEGL